MILEGEGKIKDHKHGLQVCPEKALVSTVLSLQLESNWGKYG